MSAVAKRIAMCAAAILLLLLIILLTGCSPEDDEDDTDYTNRYGSTSAPDYILRGTSISEDALRVCSKLYHSDGDITACVLDWNASDLARL